VQQIYEYVILHIPDPDMVIYQALGNFKLQTHRKKIDLRNWHYFKLFAEATNNELSE